MRRFYIVAAATILSLALAYFCFETVRQLVNAIFFEAAQRYRVIRLVKP